MTASPLASLFLLGWTLWLIKAHRSDTGEVFPFGEETMRLQPGLSTIENVDVEVLVEEARKGGGVVYVLPSIGVVDREAFFGAVRAHPSTRPPLVSSRSSEALADRLAEFRCYAQIGSCRLRAGFEDSR